MMSVRGRAFAAYMSEGLRRTCLRALQLAGLACLGLAAEGLQLRPSPMYMSEGLQLVGLAAEGLQLRPTSCKLQLRPASSLQVLQLAGLSCRLLQRIGRCLSSPTSCQPSDIYIGLGLSCKPSAARPTSCKPSDYYNA